MPGDHSSLSVSTGTGIFLYSRKNELFAAAKKKRYLASGKRFHLNLYRNCEEKMKNHENTSVYFEDS